MSEDQQAENQSTDSVVADPPLEGQKPNGEAVPTPLVPTGGEVLIEVANPSLMAQLRAVDHQHKLLNDKSASLITGYAMAKGWDLTTHNVSVSFETGMITVSPIS